MAAAGNWKLGLFYSAVTTIAWGLLPIALKVMMGWMDAYRVAQKNQACSFLQTIHLH